MSDPVIRNPHPAPADTPPTLVEFILARLDEDQRVALDATRQHERAVAAFKVGRPDDMQDEEGESAADWSGGSDEDDRGYFRRAVWAGEGIATICEMHDEQDDASPTHIARHDPARVLAEVAAKRRIVELHSGAHECSTFDRNGEIDNCTWCLDSDECSTVALLASVYTGHPDYRPEWHPEAVAEHR